MLQVNNKPQYNNHPSFFNPFLSRLTILLIIIAHASDTIGPVHALRYNSDRILDHDNPRRTLSHYANLNPNFFWSNTHDQLNNNHDNSENLNGSFIQNESSPEGSQQGWTDLLSGIFSGPKKDSLDEHIRKILVPRVSGTPGNVQVRDYIVKFLQNNDYHVELDQFTDTTPIGKVDFANIIATSNPRACRQLVLACHYDSKMQQGFLGATDSAVPCAMLLEIARDFKSSFKNQDLALNFIFFDGEEAFVQWTDTDSLYGSRNLAAKWERQQAPRHCKGLSNELKRIELFMLLDLIGTSDTSFVMYNQNLKHHYQALQGFEKNILRNKHGLQSEFLVRREIAFKNRHIPLDLIQDDHVPFYKRGVPILSLLASPFPSVWHTNSDNYSAIDFARTRRILDAIKDFVANYESNI